MTNRSGINVTPLIDVLLVLLIIFMVITPLASHGVPAQVPQTPADVRAAVVEEAPVVLMVAADGTLRINHELTRREDLAERLRKIFQYRSARVLFVDAAPETEFELVARVVDEAKAIASVGLMPGRR